MNWYKTPIAPEEVYTHQTLIRYRQFINDILEGSTDEVNLYTTD